MQCWCEKYQLDVEMGHAGQTASTERRSELPGFLKFWISLDHHRKPRDRLKFSIRLSKRLGVNSQRWILDETKEEQGTERSVTFAYDTGLEELNGTAPDQSGHVERAYYPEDIHRSMFSDWLVPAFPCRPFERLVPPSSLYRSEPIKKTSRLNCRTLL